MGDRAPTSWEELDPDEWPTLESEAFESSSESRKKQQKKPPQQVEEQKSGDARGFHPYFDSLPQFRIMKKSDASQVPSKEQGNTGSNSTTRSLEQRQQEYDAVRQRILGSSS